MGATRPAVLDGLLPLSPEEQAAGSRVTDPKAKAKGRPKSKAKTDKTTEDGKDLDKPKTRKTGDEKKTKEAKKGRNTGKPKAKAKASPKNKANKKTPAETNRKRKGDIVGTEQDKDSEKEGPSAAKLAIRARNSRKSSAYHQAYKKALAAGSDIEAAKAEGQAVT